MIQPVIYYQTDPRWADVPYATKGELSTIGTAGCGPTVMAMIAATWVDKDITPLTEATWALANGFKEYQKGTNYSYFEAAAERHGLRCSRLNFNNLYDHPSSWYHLEIKKLLDEGHLIIACMGKGVWAHKGHFVLVYGIQDEIIFIVDPASPAMYKTRGNLTIFKSQVKYYWCVAKLESI